MYVTGPAGNRANRLMQRGSRLGDRNPGWPNDMTWGVGCKCKCHASDWAVAQSSRYEVGNSPAM